MVFLADYALKSKWRALLLTLFSAGSVFFCWIGAALVALITLRKGVTQGAWLALWAILPAGAIALYYGDAGPVSLLLGSFSLALVLRTTVSLPLTLLTSVAVAFVIAAAMLLVAQDQLALITNGLEQMLSRFNQQLAEQGGQAEHQLKMPGVVQVAGMLGLISGVGCVLCLLLGRYWQACLYRPGGFGEEFKALRLPPVVAAALVLGSVVLVIANPALSSWAMALVLPMHFAGLALVHDYADYRQRSTAWLVLFYLVWLLLEPIKLIVIVLALADSWFDLRKRFKK